MVSENPFADNNVTSNTNAPTSLFQRLKQSSHPIATFVFLAFKFGPLLVYLFGLLFTSNFIMVFIIVVLLLAGDFWDTKNVAGRLMVGLRWWNETSQTGESIWVFETADPQRYINPIDSKVFWIMIYAAPALWMVLGIVAILKFEFLSLILVGMAIVLTITNAMAFTKCDKFGKANDIAGNFMGSVTSGLLSGFAGRLFGGR